jgi:release factor glutamine methyltransferase
VTQRLIEILQKSTDYLTRHGIDTPRVDAEWILSHALHIPRLELYLRFDQPLAEPELSAIRPMLTRRGQREPLAYIVGSSEFHEVVLSVDKRVLVPRPETEILVEKILQRHSSAKSFLDIGTGSGAIAIALAKALPNASVSASDISSEALDLARENAHANGVEVEFIHSDLLQSIRGTFDVIVSNPPYVTESEYSGLVPEIVRYEPKIALTAPEYGLYCYRHMLETAAPYLNPGGRIWFEIGHGQAEAIFSIGEANGWICGELIRDYNDYERVVFLSRPEP